MPKNHCDLNKKISKRIDGGLKGSVLEENNPWRRSSNGAEQNLIGLDFQGKLGKCVNCVQRGVLHRAAVRGREWSRVGMAEVRVPGTPAIGKKVRKNAEGGRAEALDNPKIVGLPAV